MIQVKRRVKVKPPVARHARLQAAHIRHRQHQKPARLQDPRALVQGPLRVFHMLEYMPEGDGFEIGVRETNIRQAPGFQVNAVFRLLSDPVVELEAGAIPAPGAHHQEEVPPAAADIQYAPFCRKTLYAPAPSLPHHLYEPFKGRGEPGGVLFAVCARIQGPQG